MLYSAMLVSAIQQCDSVITIYSLPLVLSGYLNHVSVDNDCSSRMYIYTSLYEAWLFHLSRLNIFLNLFHLFLFSDFLCTFKISVLKLKGEKRELCKQLNNSNFTHHCHLILHIENQLFSDINLLFEIQISWWLSW